MNYAHALETALDAARKAGAMLREDFHRPGGPRGLDDHADLDKPAEEAIRRILQAEFPDWGHRGEETGEAAGAPGEEHRWIVDPNDGTRSFLRGWRGAAVSIALVRGERPVLGVVYAYAVGAEGDLVSWAEGCGPVRRNGRPVEGRRQDVVLVSQDADRKSEVNARLVAPRRFLVVPSVAWRLARVAAGDGIAASSLSSPCDWDVAAGHALLLGAGMDLFDSMGQPIRYDRWGGGNVFGGDPEVVRELVGRDWGAVHGGRQEEQEYDLAFPKRELLLADPAVLSRAQGCLLGMVAGDSLGSLVEFRTAEDIRQTRPQGVRRLEDGGHWNTLAGQPTDDSELGLLLARSIRKEGRYSPRAAARAYGWWYRSGPFDVGSTTSRALRAVSADGDCDAEARAAANRESQANGSLMRIAPLAVWGWSLPTGELAEFARQDSALTHPNPVCQDACAAFVVGAAQAIRTGSGAYEAALGWARQHAHPDIVASLEAAADGPPAEFHHQMGWVRTALQNAFYRVLHQGLEEGVVDTVACGGDTDTNAAIAGALLGATYGREAVPAQWEDRVLTCRPMGRESHPRPRALWPVDVLILAEQLAALGLQVEVTR